MSPKDWDEILLLYHRFLASPHQHVGFKNDPAFMNLIFFDDRSQLGLLLDCTFDIKLKFVRSQVNWNRVSLFGSH